jgi:hypothetical protein
MLSKGGTLQREEDGLPNASKYVSEVLRGGSYSFVTAIADLVDNCIEAEATHISISIDFNNHEVMISDNGCGMTDTTHHESMKVAAQTRGYKAGDLGRYGTGMKAASLSQCRKLTVATRHEESDSITVRVLDVDHVVETDDWSRLILVQEARTLPQQARAWLTGASGTVVIWQNLDRALGDYSITGENAKEELLKQAEATESHLRIVFHRFLDGSVPGRKKIEIDVNGVRIEPWDPFSRKSLTETIWDGDVAIAANLPPVHVTSFVLPGENEWPSREAKSEARGPKGWNESQGFYVYRNFRLIRSGGWLRMRTSEDHRKLARVLIDFPSELDKIFKVPVDKSSITLPKQTQVLFEPIIKAVASRAEERYRLQSSLALSGLSSLPVRNSATSGARRKLTATALSSALEKVADKTTLQRELIALKAALREEMPSIADEVGW